MAAPAAPLLAALQSLPGTAATAAAAAVNLLATTVVEAVLTAAVHMQRNVTHAAVNAVIGGPISSQSRAATLAAWHYAASGAAQTAAKNHPGNPLIVAVTGAATAINGANVPTGAALRTAIGAAVGEAYCRALGHTKSGFGAELRARKPPLNATEIAGTVVGLRNDLKAAVSAAAAMVPPAPINPEAGVPAVPPVNAYARKAARVATLAALLGEAAGATPADAAAAGVAAARVAYAAALGAPQLGCHRHPRTCVGGPCDLSIHYTTLPH